MQRVLQLSPQELETARAKAKAYWEARKRVLDPAWAELWKQLPPHVRSVLGPKKNLLLLCELVVFAESPDKTIVYDSTGIPFIGELPRSGTLAECPSHRIQLK